MRIDHETVTGVSASARTTVVAQRWLVDQLLSIRVIGRVDETSIRLSVDGQEILARTTLDFPAGARLTARVVAGGAQPVLSIVDPDAAGGLDMGSGITSTVAIRSAFAGTLPMQEPLGPVLDRLDAHAAVHPTPPGVQARVLDLTQGLPALADLTQPAPLAHAVARMGQLLEATLAAAVADSVGGELAFPALAIAQGDLKFQLLALRAAVETALQDMPRSSTQPPAGTMLRGAEITAERVSAPTPAALRAIALDVDAGIARITTHQLQHLAATERGAFYAFAELPFRAVEGTQAITLAIEADDDSRQEHAQGAGTEQGSFTLSLAVPLADLGQLRARLGLTGDRLAVTLWSEEPALRELIAADIHQLGNRLVGLGFELTRIALHEVAPPDPLRNVPRRLVETSI